MTDLTFLYSGWKPLARLLVVGTAMYVALVVFLRLSRSRTLASMNAFDFVVTVAIGSAFGRALTAKTVALAEAVAALGLLVVLQYAVTRLQVRWPSFGRAVTNPPALLYFRGEFLTDEMRRQRVAESELRSAVRKERYGSIDAVDAIVLESNGELSVVRSVEDGSAFGEAFDDGIGEP